MSDQVRALAGFLGGVALLIVSAACRPSQTVEGQVDDAKVMTEIKAKLAADVDLATLTSVEVNVTAGAVTLAGAVSSEDQKRRIEDVVRGVAGVKSVMNNVQVLVPPQPATPEAAPPAAAQTPAP